MYLFNGLRILGNAMFHCKNVSIWALKDVDMVDITINLDVSMLLMDIAQFCACQKYLIITQMGKESIVDKN